VIRAAESLTVEPAKAADRLSRYCRCENTVRILREISDLAVNVEVAARFGSPREVAQEFKEVVRKAIEIRRFIVNVPNQQLKIEARKSYLMAINAIGKALSPSNFMPIYTSESGLAPGTETTLYQDTEGGSGAPVMDPYDAASSLDPEIEDFE
jgi:hypothetical protein